MNPTAESLPDSWSDVLAELEGSPRSTEPPAGAPAEKETSRWFELYSRFSTRGFVRALVSPSADQDRFHVQFAVPAGDDPEALLEAVRAEFAAKLDGNWEIAARDPDWEVAGELPERPAPADLSAWIALVEDLARVADSGELADADWLAERLGLAESDDSAAPTEDGNSTASETGRESNASERNSGSVASSDVFESIGDGSSATDAPSRALGETRLDSWELSKRGGSMEMHLGLDRPLAAPDRERLAREVAHALRSRYDISARPLPAEDADADDTEIRLRAEPSESGLTERESPEQVRSDLESYLERLERFEGLGVPLASVLGLTDSTERQHGGTRGTSRSDEDRRDERVDSQKRGRGRRETPRPQRDRDRTAKPRSSGRGSDETAASSDGVVLGIDADDAETSTTPTTPEEGLEPGKYRDPRLMRDDATTSLVDIVLRHPGYAEEKMGHNLSILLSVDFPDAMELVQNAPSIIAWSVGRDRALKFKRFIEDSGGKVVLVEPDSLSG